MFRLIVYICLYHLLSIYKTSFTYRLLCVLQYGTEKTRLRLIMRKQFSTYRGQIQTVFVKNNNILIEFAIRLYLFSNFIYFLFIYFSNSRTIKIRY